MNNKKDLLKELKNTHHKIVDLITSLSEEQLTIPYHPGVNPPLWELGHSSFFYEVFILKAQAKNDVVQTPSFDPEMDDIWDSFNIDHEDRWQKGLIPGKVQTLYYVNVIHKAILAHIEDNELTQEDLYLYKYAIFHQKMHIESLVWARQTSSYAQYLSKTDTKTDIKTAIPTTSSISGDAIIPTGKYLIGMPEESDDYAGKDFAFDNEKPWFEVELAEFHISKTLVSNKEFIAFIDAGGYENPSYWSFGGKKWLKNSQAKHPVYWKQEQGQWLERFFDQWQTVIDEFPVIHVCFWEVEAYCQWLGRRLPTEYEWEVAALGNAINKKHHSLPWGNTMDHNKVDMDATHMARIPVTAYSESDSPFGCRQMIGTVWEWTSSQYLPYDGFTMDMYAYMSTLQFGYHKTTKGGSCATSSNLIRGSYRQAYYPDRNDVYVGFRTCAL
ncbi:MAG: ergothioneine biosynthesis protein EgtB [Gammaproteobacteria bacterium]|nr:ergothioneine biosynthesis protein EgtB [Gammaproteobacteria bacterium]